MNFNQHLIISLVAGVTSLLVSSQAFATPEVVVDNTIFGVPVTGALPGNPVEIVGENHGLASGSNLFFSFSKFNLPSPTDQAIFSCQNSGCQLSTGIPIANVITRINSTGTDGASIINGSISFGTNLSGANLWMFNPQGILIGNGASINVPGALHVSNASQLNFDSGSFGLEQDPQGNLSNLSDLFSAPPATFGFIAFDPDGPGPLMAVLPSGGVFLNGGQITTTNGAIDVRATQISVGSTSLTAGGSYLTLNGDNLIVQDGASASLNTGGTLRIEGQMNGQSTLVTAEAGNGSLSRSSGINTLSSSANINNYGYFDGNVTSTSGSLNNANGDGLNAEINGNATAATTLSNNGIIRKNASAGTSLTNSSQIIGSATATGNITNNSGATIGGNVNAGGDLTNNGTISQSDANSASVHAGGDINNYGTISLNGSGTSEVTAGRDLNNHSGSSISLSGSGNSRIQAGRNMDVYASTVTMSNSGDSTVSVGGNLLIDGLTSQSFSSSAGKISFANGGKASLLVSGNLTVGSSGLGIIERTGSSTEVFTIDPINPGTGIYINNSGSYIYDSRNNSALMQILAADFITLTSGGAIYRGEVIDGNVSANSLQAQLLLVAKSLNLSQSFIGSTGTLDLGQLNKVLTLNFIGSGSAIGSIGNFGKPSQVYYTLPSNGAYGNIVGSVNGLMYVNPDNLQSIRSNFSNKLISGNIANGFRLSPNNNTDLRFETGFNLFINAVPIFSTGLTDQVGAVISGETEQAVSQNFSFNVVNKSMNALQLPNDSCGSGSSLQISRSNGVVPILADQSSFSVFPGDQPINNASAEFDPLAITLASNVSKTSGCGRG